MHSQSTDGGSDGHRGDDQRPSIRETREDPGGATPGSRRFVAHSKDSAVVPVPFEPGHSIVPRWNRQHEARGWMLEGADLSMPGGRPYGSLWYVRSSDKRVIRVGVRWNVDAERVQCTYLHPTKGVPGADRGTFDADAVELDAQARVTALQSINAFLFMQLASRSTEDAILAAAGLGLRRIDAADEPAS